MYNGCREEFSALFPLTAGNLREAQAALAPPCLLPERLGGKWNGDLVPVYGSAEGIPVVGRIGRDQLIFSQSFLTLITTSAGLRQVMSVYGQMNRAHLAKHDLQAKVLTAFAATSHFNPNENWFPVCIALEAPTADPVLLTRAAHALLPPVHKGVKDVRAGIMVTDLLPTGNQKPLEIFENPHEEPGIGILLEDVSKRYGRGALA